MSEVTKKSDNSSSQMRLLGGTPHIEAIETVSDCEYGELRPGLTSLAGLALWLCICTMGRKYKISQMWHRSSRGTLGWDKVIISTDTTGHAAAAPPPSYFYTPVNRRRHDQQQKRFRSVLILLWQLPCNVNMLQLQNFFEKRNGEFVRSCGLLNLVMKPFSRVFPSK